MTLSFFLKRDIKDNRLFWIAPVVLFAMLFTVTLLWRGQRIPTKTAIFALQICTFLFIFISATLYGIYLNSVIGTSLHIKTQMSLTRNYLFSLPISRARLFCLNQVRLLLPLMPFVLLGTFFVVTFNPVASKITAFGLLSVGFCLAWLALNYFSWLCYLIERSFENKSFSHAFRGFFIYNPIFLLIIYYLFARNIPQFLEGFSWYYFPALLAPLGMAGLNYVNWMKRD